VKLAVSDGVHKGCSFAQSVLQAMAEGGMDCIRFVDYTSQWAKDYSSMSPDVKGRAGDVKHVVDRCGVFGSFSEMFISGQELFLKKAKNAWNQAGAALDHIGASADFYGRLDDLKAISLGAAKPFIAGVGSIADAANGLVGIRNAIVEPREGSTLASTTLKVAKNVAFIALAVLGGILACVATSTSVFPALPLYVLTAASTYLGLKVASKFYDALMLPMPIEVKMS
jgi:hypothetical protein